MLNVALKEWDLVISELLAGEQVILLRKGGILEAENQFELEHRRFLFYPTFIHQDPRMVKPAFRGRIRTLAAEPEAIAIRGYGEVAGIFEVPMPEKVGREKLASLEDLHIWDQPLIDMRFAYRAEKPLYVVAIRAFILPRQMRIASTLAYAGCKSWVPLEEEVDVSGATVALAEDKMAGILERLSRTLHAG